MSNLEANIHNKLPRNAFKEKYEKQKAGAVTTAIGRWKKSRVSRCLKRGE